MNYKVYCHLDVEIWLSHHCLQFSTSVSDSDQLQCSDAFGHSIGFSIIAQPTMHLKAHTWLNAIVSGYYLVLKWLAVTT